MKKLVVFAIVFLALFLRTVNLFDYPVGFTPDEASFAYDAYSILKTGKDQWGVPFPLVLESFGDYKAPVLSYLTIPFVSMLGLLKESVRLPNALLGTLAVFVTYLMVKEFLNYGNKNQKGSRKTEIVAITTSFLLAISPWHVQMSRGGFEANLTTFFMPLGVLFFLKGLKNKKYLYWSSLSFGINLFTYHSAKLVTPFIIFFLVFIFKKKIAKLWKTKPYKRAFVFSTAVLSVFVIVTFYTFRIGAGARAKDVSIFGGAMQEASVDRLIAIENGMPLWTAKALHNKYIVVPERFLNNYAQYFSGRFLFVFGPAEGTYGMVPGQGVLYWFELPFLIAFIIYVFNKKTKLAYLVSFWLIVAPIPASLAQGVGFSANRAVIMLPAFSVASALGGYYIYSESKKMLTKKHLLRPVLVFYSLIVLATFLIFLERYFVLSPVKIGQDMLYGNLEAAVWARDKKADKVIISKGLSEPHIYIAFAAHFDPSDYQKFSANWDYKAKNVSWVDQMPEYRLGNYIFKSIDWSKDSAGNTYLIGRPEDFPANISPRYVIDYPNNTPAVYIVDPSIKNYANRY